MDAARLFCYLTESQGEFYRLQISWKGCSGRTSTYVDKPGTAIEKRSLKTNPKATLNPQPQPSTVHPNIIPVFWLRWGLGLFPLWSCQGIDGEELVIRVRDRWKRNRRVQLLPQVFVLVTAPQRWSIDPLNWGPWVLFLPAPFENARERNIPSKPKCLTINTSPSHVMFLFWIVRWVLERTLRSRDSPSANDSVGRKKTYSHMRLNHPNNHIKI